MVTKEEIQQFPWGVLYIVGRLWTLKTCNIGCCAVKVKVFFELPGDHLGIETCSIAVRL